MIRAVIKGSQKQARRAAGRHRVPIKNCRVVGAGAALPRLSHSMACDVPCKLEPRLAEWFAERATRRKGRGHAPGTLTFYSTRDCGGISKRWNVLGGGRRRR